MALQVRSIILSVAELYMNEDVVNYDALADDDAIVSCSPPHTEQQPVVQPSTQLPGAHLQFTPQLHDATETRALSVYLHVHAQL